MRISDWSSDVCSSDLPERPAPSLAPPPDADAVAAGRLLAPIVGHTRQTTLAAIVLLDRNGIVVGGDGGSLATLPEVRAALAGEPETVLRRNASYRAVYRFEWLSRAAALRVDRKSTRSEEHTSEHQSLMRISSAAYSL